MKRLKKNFHLPDRSVIHMLLLICLMILPAKVTEAGFNDNQRQFVSQFEIGPVWQGRNVVQIPNNPEGSRFSLVDLVGNGPYPAFRFYFTWRISLRHDLRLLLAPLNYTQTGTFSRPVSFAGQTYLAGLPLDGSYKFNSWRLTYRYKFYQGEQWQWWIGFTAKIRDARIKLEQNRIFSEKTDLGFVPLLHLRAEYQLSKNWWTLLDIDALAGGPGRAEDATIQIGYDLSNSLSLSLGYRMLEGGADVEAVYNFAWLHYFITSVNLTF